jgi:hypothetical protein
MAVCSCSGASYAGRLVMSLILLPLTVFLVLNPFPKTFFSVRGPSTMTFCPVDFFNHLLWPYVPVPDLSMLIVCSGPDPSTLDIVQSLILLTLAVFSLILNLGSCFNTALIYLPG